MKKEENILIAAIRYCVKKNGDTIYRNELAEHLNNTLDKEMTENNSQLIQIFNQIINIQGKEGEIDCFGHLKLEAYYHLIEYDSMQSANILARKAIIRSNIAIVIAVAALATDILFRILSS